MDSSGSKYGYSPEEYQMLNELLSRSTMRSYGTINGQPNATLSALMNPPPQEPPMSQQQLSSLQSDNTDPDVFYGSGQSQQQPPKNYFKNESTGVITDMDFAAAPAGPELDYSQPIEYAGMGKGYRVKGDPFSAIINGQKVSMGQDVAATRARQKEDLALEKTRAEIAKLKAPAEKTADPEAVQTQKWAMTMYSQMPTGEMKQAFGEKYGLAGKVEKDKEEKPVPISAAKSILSNRDNLRKAQTALTLLSGGTVDSMEGDKEATGWKGYAPEAVLQRTDPTGVNTRAAIGDIGSMVIHDRSGAAVTASEFPRLRPFIPLVTDDPETARKKLNRFVSEYSNLVEDTEGFYTDSGYKVPKGEAKGKSATNAAVPIKGNEDYAKLPSGTVFTGPDGKQRRKP